MYKHHKFTMGLMLRPILSMINTPQQGMAKWIAELLQPVVERMNERKKQTETENRIDSEWRLAEAGVGQSSPDQSCSSHLKRTAFKAGFVPACTSTQYK